MKNYDYFVVDDSNWFKKKNLLRIIEYFYKHKTIFYSLWGGRYIGKFLIVHYFESPLSNSVSSDRVIACVTSYCEIIQISAGFQQLPILLGSIYNRGSVCLSVCLFLRLKILWLGS